MKKSSRVLLLLIISLFTMLNGVSAAKPVSSNTTSLKVTTFSSYKSISLSYQLVNSKKIPDKYIIYRGTLKVYEGKNTSFYDSGLRSGTGYSYTVEALSNGKILAKAAHIASTLAIVVNPIEITSTVQPDNSVNLTWFTQNSGLAPNQYKIFVDGTLNTTLSPSTSSTQTTAILGLQPGNHLIKIEGWYQDELVSQGNSTASISEPVTAPYTIEINWDTQDFNSREMQIYFSYDDNLKPADRMVITRNKVTLVNGVPTEAEIAEVVYDGEPIAMYTETQFGLDVVRYNYNVVNYHADRIVGSGTASVPNFFDY
ncbi:hypothetical protein P9D43_15975 [Neobacillus niacini]|uniref:hypothetical protein n=1 Tax=Neobacillus niacini TaxID=86668 RepID=UPI0007AB8FD1|nr:hypothetical protein [Neobacillus niacini]MEC1523501.1 hypothetical protein [Neobacillus niacini]